MGATQQVLSAYGAVTATKLAFGTQPDGAITAVNFTQQPVVRATDANGTLATGFTGNVTLAVNTGSGSLSGTATVAAVGGVATFAGLKITGAGKHVLEATASGLTAKRSGMMTVMPAATAAKTVLSFGANTSDKIDCGSGASMDDLVAAGTFFGIVRLKRTATGPSQYILSKYNGGATGVALSISDTLATGEIAVNLGRATTDALVISDSSNVVVVGNTYDVAVSFDGTTVRIYLALVGTALNEVSGYEASSSQGSGAGDTDAGASVYIGNLQIAPTNPVKGDIEWVALFSKVPTAAERLTVQIGFDRNSVAMITGIGGCVGLWQCNATGTLTDLSGNSNSGTVTGATTTTGETVFAPTVFADTIDATDQTDYLFTKGHSSVSYVTAATALTASMQRSNDLTGTYDAQAAVAALVNGTYNNQMLVTTANTKQYGTVTGMSGSSKTVTLLNSLHTRNGAVGSGSDAYGALLTAVRFNASATEVIPATPATSYLFCTDSIYDGYVTDPVGRDGPIERLRAYIAGLSGAPATYSIGHGGQTLNKIAVDAGTRTATVAEMAKYNPTYIVIHLGLNDYISSVISAATYETQYAALMVEINSQLPDCRIYAVTPVTLATGEGANGLGSTLPNYRTGLSNAASGKAYVTLLDGPTIWNATNLGDTVHPNSTGGGQVATGTTNAIGI